MRKLLIVSLFAILGFANGISQSFNRYVTLDTYAYRDNVSNTIKTLEGGHLSYGKINASNFCLIKTDVLGDTSWIKIIQNNNGSDIDIIQIPDSTYVITIANSIAASKPIDILYLHKSGNYFTRSFEYDFSGIVNGVGYSNVRTVLNNSGNLITFAHHNNGENIVVFLTDTLGNVINQKTILTSFPNTPAPSFLLLRNLKVKLLSNGNVFISGINGSDVNNYIYFMEFDSSGNMVWRYLVENNTGLLANFNVDDIEELSDGSVIISGGCASSLIANGTTLFKFDNSRNLLFTKTLNDNAQCVKAEVTLSNNIYLASGSTNNTSDSLYRLAFYNFDSSGNILNSSYYGHAVLSSGLIVVNDIFSNNTGVNIFSTYSFQKLNILQTDSNYRGAVCYDTLTNNIIQDVLVTETPWSPSTNSLTAFVSTPYPQLVNDGATIENIGLTRQGIVSNPACYGDFGQINYTVTGGTSPYAYSWSNGTNSPNLVNASSGQYTVRVVDAAGCAELDTFTIVEPQPLAASFQKTDVTCFSAFDGSVNLTVSGGTPSYSYFWANGAQTEDISGLGGGFYQVTITDTNGCQLTQGISVAEPGPLTANVIGFQNVSCHGLCDGVLTGSASGGTAPYMYQWNDVNNQTTPIADSLCNGIYLLTVTDTNGCVAYANALVSQPPVIQNSLTTTNATCGNTDGGAMVNTSGGTPPYSYLWSDGSTANPNTNLAAGTYMVTGTDANGCADSAIVTIETDVASISICEVTVDSTSSKNLVIWEKPVATNIAGFNIYRDVVGLYQLIDFVPYDSLSEYVDENSGIDPSTTSYRYKISAVDTCGNEGARSNYHETIHLTTNQGINGEVNLIWDGYKGFQFGYYRIIVDTSNNNIEDFYVLDSVAYTNFTWTDNTPPSGNYLVYAVEIVTPYTCTSTRAQSHNTTRSNRATVAGPGTGGTTIEEAILNQAEVYPNPFSSDLTVQSSSSNWSYQLVDLTGKVIQTGRSTSPKQTIDLSETETGVYLLQISINEYTVTKRVVKR